MWRGFMPNDETVSWYHRSDEIHKILGVRNAEQEQLRKNHVIITSFGLSYDFDLDNTEIVD